MSLKQPHTNFDRTLTLKDDISFKISVKHNSHIKDNKILYSELNIKVHDPGT